MSSDLPPNRPTPDELRAAEKAIPGGGIARWDEYIKQADAHVSRLQQREDRADKDASHKRLYSMVSVLSGTFLATISIALVGFALFQKADLTPVAWVLAPVTSIAGVFVWGYRPKTLEQAEAPAPLPAPQTNA